MYIGIDLGTSAVKLLLCDEDGAILKTTSKPYPMYMPHMNWAEQNPEDWWEMTKEALREVTVSPQHKAIKGISFSGQMHGLVILDEHDQVIRPAILWCDQRTQKECDMLHMNPGIDNLIAFTGNRALTGFTAPKLLWLKEHEPENFRRIHKIMLPKDYIQYQLTGTFASDMSDASGTLLLDVKHRCWSADMLRIIGIREEQLPELYESYERVGLMKKEWLHVFQFTHDVVVAAGAGDQGAGAIGVGAIKDGLLSVSLGTSGVVFLPCHAYQADSQARLHTFAHANGKYHQMGVVLSAAGALKWWLETIQNDHDYQQALESDANNAKAQQLFFLPYLIGERTPMNDATAKGCFIGLNLTHTKGDMTKALMEGVGFALRESYEIIKRQNVDIHHLRISGGGSQSDTWNQLIADIFQLPVSTIETQQGPAYGAAILAKAAVTGDSLDLICASWIAEGKTYLPERSKKAYYDQKFINYQSMYPILKPIFQRLSEEKSCAF